MVEQETTAVETTPTTRNPRELRHIYDIVMDLASPDNWSSLVRTRQQGRTDIRYLAWHDVTRVLDKFAPGWRYEVKEVAHIKDKVVLIAAIEIPTTEGIVRREATGNEDDVTSSYGDPFSNAESMALRRAAAKFGVGRSLYNGG